MKNTIETVTFKELEEVFSLLKYRKKKTAEELIFYYKPADSLVKFRLPKSPDDLVNPAILKGHAFILKEKGIIKTPETFWKIIENQRFLREHVLV